MFVVWFSFKPYDTVPIVSLNLTLVFSVLHEAYADIHSILFIKYLAV